MVVVYDPLVQDDPYAAYRALRQAFPVYRNEERGFWALSRFEDVQRGAGVAVLVEVGAGGRQRNA